MKWKPSLGNDFCVLERVPEYRADGEGLMDVVLAIIDLETTGLNYKTDKITEIGVIVVTYPKSLCVFDVLKVYQQFNDPGVDICPQITKLTGITNEMVKGYFIDWECVKSLLVSTNFIVCHNAAFDRKFLEQTPLGDLFKEKVFACSKNDVDWQFRGYGANKLDYLNWKMGYFYDGHRAINDCWATLNILTQEDGALEELISNTNDEYEVYAINAPYPLKDELREKGFWWNSGENGKPKAWFYKPKTEEERDECVHWLRVNHSIVAEVVTIPANRKYSSEV